MKLADHPLHPALAHFPVAFWAAAVAADAAALVTDDSAWWTWSHHALVAGLITAGVALLAGGGEAFFRRIPRQAMRTLALHITSMVLAFALFLASLALRKQSPPSTVAIALSALGLAALLLGGWFGGSLVYRFGVGTQHTPPDSSGQSMTHPAPPASARPFLETLKRKGPATIRELSQRLRVTYEAARQQMNALLEGGWVTAAPLTAVESGPGRRPQRYVLSEAGEHVFPKHYDALTSELVATLAESCGSKTLLTVLERMTQARVERWRPVLSRLPLKARLQALRGLYEEEDAYMEVKWRGKTPLLIERNCPFLRVARAHPALCSVSVCTLSRLLGVRVVRERRFQDGDGRCVFRVCVDEPLATEMPLGVEEPKPA